MANEKALGRKSVFLHSCKACGECCRNAPGLILSPQDILRMAKHKQVPLPDFVAQHVKFTDSTVPMLLLNDIDEVCTLLEDCKCSVYAAKPFCCSLYPLGFTYGNMPHTEDYFLKPGTPCLGQGKKHTLRNWLLGLREERGAFRQWFTDYADMMEMLDDAGLPMFRRGLLAEKIHEKLKELLVFQYDFSSGVYLEDQYTMNVLCAKALVERYAEEYGNG